MAYFRQPQTYRPHRMRRPHDGINFSRQTRRAIEAEEDARSHPLFYPEPNLLSDRRGRGSYAALAIAAALMLTVAVSGCITGYGDGSGTVMSKNYDSGHDKIPHTDDDKFAVNVSDLDGAYQFVITEKTLYKGKPIGSSENLSRIYNQTGKDGIIGIKFNKDEKREKPVYEATEITSWRNAGEMNKERADMVIPVGALFAAVLPLSTAVIWVPALASRLRQMRERKK